MILALLLGFHGLKSVPRGQLVEHFPVSVHFSVCEQMKTEK